MKKTFYTELAYMFGIAGLALGVALMERANFGLSMIVAPAYVFFQIMKPHFPFFSFGMAEYVFQAFVLLLLIPVMRKFKVTYLFSFVTAVLYGFVLDGIMLLTTQLPDPIWLRAVYYVLGMVICSFGVSMMFHTYISPEVYELFVKEVSGKFRVKITKFKTGYDLASLLIAVLMSLIALGEIVGVSWGTLLCAFINGWIIGRISALFEHFFEFRDAFLLRRFF